MGNAKRDAYLDILADEFEKMGMMDEDGWDTLEKPVPNAKTVKPEPAVGQEKPELPTAKPKNQSRQPLNRKNQSRQLRNQKNQSRQLQNQKTQSANCRTRRTRAANCGTRKTRATNCRTRKTKTN